jgi:hypothetical protein
MPNNESVDIFGRRRRHPEKRIDCAKPVARRRQRKPSVRSMIKDAEKAGAKVTVAADGSVTLQFGEAEKPTDNEWDEVYGKDKAPTRQ